MVDVRPITQRDGFCFAAGTLVHTKEGLVPIEKIKIGDWVLSQPEETGEKAYKRVVNTVGFENKDVWSVSYFEKTEREQARLEKRMMREDCESRLVVTGNHPFWVKGKGWKQARDLLCEEELELSDGRSAIVGVVDWLHQSGTEGVAWQQDLFDTTVGTLIDLRDKAYNESPLNDEKTNLPDCINNPGDESSLFRCSVYNFEVEDFHTYYVGTKGIWVHNTNCAENVGGRTQGIADGLVPSNGTRLYFTQAEAKQLAGPNRGVILAGQTGTDHSLMIDTYPSPRSTPTR